MAPGDGLVARQAISGDEVDAALQLRERVFCGEQGVSLEAERDGRDPEAIHLVVLSPGGVIGTCRLLLGGEVARLGRMAVAAEWRGSGAGSALLSEADRAAREAGAELIRLHAQLSARGVYERAGYTESGPVFTEEGIAHVTMEKRVA